MKVYLNNITDLAIKLNKNGKFEKLSCRGKTSILIALRTRLKGEIRSNNWLYTIKSVLIKGPLARSGFVETMVTDNHYPPMYSNNQI